MTAPDRRAFAEEVFDHHAEEIYRYILAWTGDRHSAFGLTAQVLRAAVTRMERLAEPGADVEARLIALARAAVARRTEATGQTGGGARDAGAFAAAEPVPLLLEAVARLDDARREVLILRQLLGHSTEHATRLLAFDAPVVEELERDAYATLWRRLNHATQTQQVTSWDALTVATALRQGAQTWLALPDEAVMASLRAQLLGEVDQERKRPAVAVSAGAAAEVRRRLLSPLLSFAVQRRWLLAGCVASATIGTVAALAMGGQMGESSPCGAPGCLVSTTVAAVEGTVASPPSSAQEPSGLPTSTTRASAGPAFPPLTRRAPETTEAAMTTTTTPTTTPGSSTTRPRRSTTTTTMRSTTTSTMPETSTTAGATSTAPAGAAGAGGL
ncbi:MAG TPA: hypothetical protein VFA46_17190 [Actinomycetes bacterium]|nr:hypothetical protein [Actinomycetes bacterium]